MSGYLAEDTLFLLTFRINKIFSILNNYEFKAVILHFLSLEQTHCMEKKKRNNRDLFLTRYTVLQLNQCCISQRIKNQCSITTEEKTQISKT